jgi:hypothetical protein
MRERPTAVQFLLHIERSHVTIPEMRSTSARAQNDADAKVDNMLFPQLCDGDIPPSQPIVIPTSGTVSSFIFALLYSAPFC